MTELAPGPVAANSSSARLRPLVFPGVMLGLLCALGVAQARLDGAWPTALIFVLISVPLALFGIYIATLRRIVSRAAFMPAGIIRRYFNGPWVSVLVRTLLALVAVPLIAGRMIGFGWFELTLLAAAPLVLFAVRHLIQPRIEQEYAPFLRIGWGLRASVWISASLLVLLEILGRIAGGGVARYASLEEAITAGRAGAGVLGHSAFAAALSLGAGILNGVEAYALGLMSGGSWSLPSVMAVVLAGLVAFSFHFAVCAFVASFLVPLREYGRILSPVAEDEPPAVLPRMGLFLAAVLGGILLATGLSVLLLVDEALRGRPEIQAALERGRVKLERIDGVYVKEGTLAEIGQVVGAVVAARDQKTAPLEQALDAGFAAMTDNVDLYLDWYYSLPAEYGRIGHMLIGDLEAYIARNMSEALMEGDPFAEYSALLEEALGAEAADGAELRTRVAEIVAANRVEPGGLGNVTVVAEADMDTLLRIPAPDNAISLKGRVAAGAVAGGISGAVATVVAAKILAKVMAKGTIKLGAAAVAKVVGGKALSGLGATGAGAAAGAAVGSVVPVVGTAVGALVGGVIAGFAVGAGADYLLLELEEAFSREAQRVDLLEAIAAVREEMRFSSVAGAVPAQ